MASREKPGVSWKVSDHETSGYMFSIIVVVTLIIGFLCLWVRDQVNADYERTYGEASRETMNLVRALEEHVRESIFGAEADLVMLRNIYERHGFSPEAYEEFGQHLRTNPEFSMFAVINEQGGTSVTSSPIPGQPDFSQREFFAYHRDHADGRLNIGYPFQGYVTGLHVIPLSLRINHPDGGFAGVAYIGLRSDTFSKFYQKMELGDDKLISVTGLDGVIRARQMKENMEGGQDVAAGDLIQNAAIAKQGTFFSKSLVDDVFRVRSYHVMPDYPLIISVGVSADAVFSPYEKRKKIYIAGLLVVSCCLVLLSGFFIKRMKRVISEKEDQYQSIIAAMAEGVLLYDSRGVIRACNGSAENILGLSAQELLDEKSFNSHWKVVDEAGNPVARKYMPDVMTLATNKGMEAVLGLQKPEAPLMWLLIRSKPLFRSAAEKAYGVVVTFTDVTEKKMIAAALRESGERFAALIEQSSEAVIVYDIATSRVVEVNQASAKMFGYGEEELLTKSLGDLATYSEAEKQQLIDLLITKGSFSSGIGQYIHKDGRRFFAERTGSLINFQGKKLALVSHRDISQEQKLRELIASEVKMAGAVQTAMLQRGAEQDFVSVRTIFVPLHIVSGDYFGYHTTSDHTKMLGYLIDVTGHGMATALHTAAIAAFMQKEMEQDVTWTMEAVRRLNRQFMKMLPLESFVAAIFFAVDLVKREITCWSAGINVFYTVTPDSVNRVVLAGSLMGIEEVIEVNVMSFPLQKDGAFCFATDGIAERFCAEDIGKGDLFAQALDAMQELANSDSSYDDCAAICIRINGFPEADFGNR